MARYRETFSKVELAAECSWWAHPTVAELPQTYGAAAERGLVFHAKAEAAIKTHGLNVPAEIEGWWTDFCSAIPCPPEELRAEVALAYNPHTNEARELEIVNRAYPELGPDWFVGTADVIALLSAIRGYVQDHKTGFFFDSVSLPRHNGQLAAIGLALRALYNLQEVQAEIHYPGDDETPGVWRLRRVNTHVFTSAELDVWREALIRVSEERQQPEPITPRPGAHCREKFCPGYSICPATVSTAAELIPAKRLSEGAITVERLGAALDAYHAAEAVLKEFKRRMQEFAESTGQDSIELGDGRRYIKIAGGSRTYLDRDLAEAELTAEQLRKVSFTKSHDGYWKAVGRKKKTNGQ